MSFATSIRPHELTLAILPDPLRVAPHSTVMAAIALMSGMHAVCPSARAADSDLENLQLEARASCVLVAEGDRLLGILTERDIVRLSAQGQSLNDLLVGQVMTSPVIAVQETDCTDIFAVLHLLQDKKIRHVPVLNAQNCVVGLLTHESLRQLSRPADLLRLRLVSEAMTAEVICASPQDSMMAIAQLMTQHRVSSVVIVQAAADLPGGKIARGMITERDIVQFQALGLNLEKIQADAVMSTPVFSVSPEDSLWTVHQIMAQRLIGRLVVTGTQGELLGIVTQTSLLKVLDPIELYTLTQILEQKVSQLEAEKIMLLEARTAELEGQVEQAKVVEQMQTQLAEQRLAELNLRKSEQFYAALAKASPVGIFSTDTMGHYTYVNERWCQIAGLDPTDARGLGWLNGIHPSDRDCVAAEWSESVQTSQPFQLEYRFQHSSGQTTWVYAQAEMEMGIAGDIVGYVGTITNISDRKQAEQCLQAQLNLERLVADLSSRLNQASGHTIAVVIDQGLREIGEFTQVDTSYIFRYSDSQSTHSMTHEWVAAGIAPNLQNAQDLPLDLFPWATALLQSGEAVYISNINDLPPEAVIDLQSFQQFGIKSVLTIPLKDRGQAIGLLGFASFHQVRSWSENNLQLLKRFADILTNALQRQQVEAELQLSEQRYASLAEAAPVGIFRTDAAGGCLYVNERWSQIAGLSLEAALGNGWVDGLHPEDREQVAAEWYHSTQENRPFKLEYRCQRPDGSFSWVFGQSIAEYDAKEQVAGYIGTITDISDRKQAEEALAASERRLRTIIETEPECVKVLSVDSTILEMNAAGLTMLEANTSSQVVGQKAISCVLPEHRTAFTDLVQRVFQGEKVQLEFELQGLQGTKRWVNTHAVPLRNEQNKIEGILAITRDITDRKQAEADRLQTEQISLELNLLENILENILAGYWDWHLPSHQEYLSPGFKQMFGYADHELPNAPESWQRLIFAEDLPGVLDCFDRHVQSHGAVPFTNEVRYRHKDGSTVWVICSGKVIEWDEAGNPLRMIGCHINITARKQAEQQLKQQLAAIEAAVDGIAILKDDRYIFVNFSHLSLFGYDQPEDLVGKSFRQLYAPEELLRFEREVFPILGLKGHWEGEATAIRKDGTAFAEGLSLTLTEDGLLICVCRDITDRKLAEQKIQQTAAQLTAINRELESFSYSVSHDLRAPLRHMNGFVNALQQQLDRRQMLTDPKVDHYLQVIDSSSQKMGQLIDGLLTLSRMGQRPIALQSLSLRELVEDAIALVQTDMKKRPPIEFVIRNLPTVIGDATLLQQVFRNLIANAVKFSRNSPAPRIEIASEQDGTIWVKDNGAGFQMEYADKLFGAFQRLHAQTEFEGTGIGLAVVQRIVQRHGGTVWAEGKPNEGATFYLKLGDETIDLPQVQSSG